MIGKSLVAQCQATVVAAPTTPDRVDLVVINDRDLDREWSQVVIGIGTGFGTGIGAFALP